MTNRTLASIGLAGALASVAFFGGSVFETGRAVANRVGSGADERAAEKAADQAARALKRRKAEEAIRYAETAVGLMPGDAGYRSLLGRAYLAAGRFDSARTALIDSLSLNDKDGSAALNLSLAQIATGDWAGARATLEAHQDTIAVRDRGLALALAGDPEGAVELLQTAARAPEADATTRQNLALALALAGRWAESKVVAAVDIPADHLNDRMMQWVAFAQPRGAADQVAALLGVTPVLDAGQPTGLALVAKPGVDVAAADPVDDFMPGTPGAVEVTAAETPAAAAEEPAEVMVAAATAAEPAPVSSAPDEAVVTAAVQETARPRVVFLPLKEVVQPIPMAPVRQAKASRSGVPAMLAAAGGSAPRAMARQGGKAAAASPASAKAPAGGEWFVQLGAFDNQAVAHERWTGLTRRVGALSAHQPHGTQAKVNGASYYRLSVGGFAQRDAISMCGEVRRAGGRCFVRQQAGDQVAAWVRQPALRPGSRAVQMASR